MLPRLSPRQRSPSLTRWERGPEPSVVGVGDVRAKPPLSSTRTGDLGYSSSAASFWKSCPRRKHAAAPTCCPQSACRKSMQPKAATRAFVLRMSTLRAFARRGPAQQRRSSSVVAGAANQRERKACSIVQLELRSAVPRSPQAKEIRYRARWAGQGGWQRPPGGRSSSARYENCFLMP